MSLNSPSPHHHLSAEPATADSSTAPLRRTTATTDPVPVSLSVVICCYTAARLELLRTAIDQTTAQLDPERDELLIVVDHAPELAALLSEASAETAGVRVLSAAGTPGLSAARNTGLRSASGEVVVFLDDDARPLSGALSAVRAAFADPAIGAIGGAVRPDHAEREPAWFPPEFGWVLGCDYRGLPGDGDEIRNPIGAAMAVRRSALQAVGGFSNRLGRVAHAPTGCEETLMGIALRRNLPALRIVRNTDFRVLHHVPSERTTVRYFLSRCRHEGRSKAMLSALVGTGAGLSAERRYTVRVLPLAVLRGLRDLAFRGDLAAGARALATVAGLIATTVGLLGGLRAARRAVAAPDSAAAPSVRPGELARLSPTAAVTVVVPTIGRPSLRETVGAVLAQTHPELELVVVDNRPTDGAVRALLTDIDDPRVRIVDEPRPGVSAARNRGIAVAEGAVVAFTDDDALPDREWITAAMATFARDRTGTVGAVTGRVLGTPAASRAEAMFEEAQIFDKGTAATVWSRRPQPGHRDLGRLGAHGPFFPFTAGECGSGNNMVLRAEAARAIGGFDPRLGTGTATRGGEDLDAFRTLLLHGWAIAYVPAAVVRHRHRHLLSELHDQCYGYGTGMAASMTKLLVSGPRGAAAVLRRLPRGIYMLLAPGSAKNTTLPSDWPLRARLIEVWGYLCGPLLYLRSAAAHRRRR